MPPKYQLDIHGLKRAKQEKCWDLSNEFLYALCRKHPNHDKEKEVLAKVLLIGRSYAAAIERRKRFSKVVGDDFYTEIVAPKIIEARIDHWLHPLSKHTQPSRDNCSEILTAHKRLTDIFYKISGLAKRSLASKYLHFHFPRLFYIYDARGAEGVAKLTPRIRKLPALTKYDEVYAKYFLRCMELAEIVKLEYGIRLSPRELDNYLLERMRRK